MDKSYEPQAFESKWYAQWEGSGCFAPGGHGTPYTILLPPPNVTGTLHMGHAFQHTLMDALIRHQRMRGRDTLWQVGTDHAGIATEMVVARNIGREGLKRDELGRDKFIGKVWEWKQESGDTIARQMRRLGASGDWSRQVFTMDPMPSQAVVEAFVRLHEQGLVYRGQRLVNWDPVLKTAISDLEVVSEEEDGFMWSIRYPLSDGSGELVVATTRPETMLGDVAVMVHPDDGRYAHLMGKTVRLPLCGRDLPIIADDYVDREFGTGVVKVTPAHDFNDYAVWKRHVESGVFDDFPNRGLINIFTPDAKIKQIALDDVTFGHRASGDPDVALADKALEYEPIPDSIPEKYRGLDRFDARKAVLADLEAAGLLVETKKHKLQVPRGDRTGQVIEPYLTDQWFVKMDTLAARGLELVEKGDIKFVPSNWINTYRHWMENIQDWCISRQLWWGHRIPAWYDEAGNVYVGRDEEEACLAALRAVRPELVEGLAGTREERGSTGSPRTESSTGSPRTESSTGSPRTESSTGSPRTESSTGSPRTESSTGSPRTESSTGSPRTESSTGSPRTESSTGSPRTESSTGSPRTESSTGSRRTSDDAGSAGTARETAEAAGIRLRQDNDVLETWFSSALWPFSTLGWPDEAAMEARGFDRYLPSDVLVTGFDIIFFWVARMIFMTDHFTGRVPFREVYITGLVRDKDGQKMSKSKGNVLDPIDLIDGIALDDLVAKRTSGLMQPQMAAKIDKHTRKEFPHGIPAFGADALRFTFASLATHGRDIKFDLARCEGYKNFCNKLWNAARFVLMNCDGFQAGVQADAAVLGAAGQDPYRPDRPSLGGHSQSIPIGHRQSAPPLPATDAERWILAQLARTTAEVEAQFAAYRFDLVSQALYEFTWNTLCDWFLELAKPALNHVEGPALHGEGAAAAESTRHTLLYVLEATLRLLHPLIPFVTEEIWEAVAPRLGLPEHSISLRPYPRSIDFAGDHARAEADIEWLKSAVGGLRRIRSELNVAPARQVALLLQGGGPEDPQRAARYGAQLKFLARIESIAWLEPGDEAPPASATLVGDLKLLVPLAGLIDLDAERARLEKEIAQRDHEIQKCEDMLGRESFVGKAPVQVVDQMRKRLAEWSAQREALEIQRQRLSSA